MPDFIIGRKEIEEIGDQGNSACEGDIDDFEILEVRKGPVRDNESVGVADAGEEMVDLRIEDSFLKHDVKNLSD